MKDQLKKYITECTIGQNIKWQRPANKEDIVDHYLYSVSPLSKLSIDTVGPSPEDEWWMRYIILIVNNFSKFVGLYPVSTSTLEFIRAFLSWVGIFGAKTLRSEGGSRFTSNMAQALNDILKIVDTSPGFKCIKINRNSTCPCHVWRYDWIRLSYVSNRGHHSPKSGRLSSRTSRSSVNIDPNKSCISDKESKIKRGRWRP